MPLRTCIFLSAIFTIGSILHSMIFRICAKTSKNVISESEYVLAAEGLDNLALAFLAVGYWLEIFFTPV